MVMRVKLKPEIGYYVLTVIQTCSFLPYEAFPSEPTDELWSYFDMTDNKNIGAI